MSVHWQLTNLTSKLVIKSWLWLVAEDTLVCPCMITLWLAIIYLKREMFRGKGEWREEKELAHNLRHKACYIYFLNLLVTNVVL